MTYRSDLEAALARADRAERDCERLKRERYRHVCPVCDRPWRSSHPIPGHFGAGEKLCHPCARDLARRVLPKELGGADKPQPPPEKPRSRWRRLVEATHGWDWGLIASIAAPPLVFVLAHIFGL